MTFCWVVTEVRPAPTCVVSVAMTASIFQVVRLSGSLPVSMTAFPEASV
jgi:hypothetical protein